MELTLMNWESQPMNLLIWMSLSLKKCGRLLSVNCLEIKVKGLLKLDNMKAFDFS